MAAPTKDELPTWSENRDARLQILGSQLVHALHTYLRALQLYKPDNDIFRKPLQQLEAIFGEIFDNEQEVRLYGDSGTLVLNDVVLRFPVAILPSVHFLLKLWAEQDAGGFTIENRVDQSELRAFLKCFAPEASYDASGPQLQGVIRTESLKRVRMRLKQGANDQLQKLTALKVDAKQYAVLLYSRLLQLVQRSFANDDAHDPATTNQLVRTLQELIDLCGTQKMRFLGFTNEMDAQAYEAYHVCNTIFFATLFGWHIRLDRIQLLDLGRAAVLHTRGKRYIPLTLLDKRTPLSPEEERELRNISVLTVLDMLKGPFSWDKLRQAVVVSGIYEPGTPLAQTPRVTTDTHTQLPALGAAPPLPVPQPGAPRALQGPWLYSHIIRLCATFDALCTRRPYRVKLYPAEALKLMQERLAHQFDPYLLHRFLDFYGPMAISSRVNPQAPVQIPHDPRLDQDLARVTSPFGHAVHDVFQHYWKLRTQRKRSPTEEKRLKTMRQTITQKMGGTGTGHDQR